MKLKVNKLKGSGDASIAVNETVFGAEFKEALVHQVVTSYLAAARSGCQKQKTRSEVSGGGKKPWRQKGTGRARSGTSSSPIWTGGGVTFAAAPRSYKQKVNKKMYRGAVRSILSKLVEEGLLVVVDKFEMKQPKTKDMKELLKKLDAEKALIVCEEVDQNLFLSARNLVGVNMIDVHSVDPYNLVNNAKVVMTEGAVKKIEEMYA